MKSFVTTIPILALLFNVGCGDSHRTESTTPQKPAIHVNAVKVESQEWPQLVEGVGTVEARVESVISARTMGYVQAVHVREGDHVSAGQTLVELAAQEIHASVDQAKAARQEALSAEAEVASAVAAAESQAALTRTTHRRMQNLHERKSISDQEFDEATAKLQAAEASLRIAQSRQQQVQDKIRQASAGVSAAESQLSYLKVKAPFAGIVTARMADPGSLASPGMPLLKLEQAGEYWLVAGFSESVLSRIRVGQKIPVAIDAIGLRGEGSVAELVPVVDASTRTFPVKIRLPKAPLLRSGLYGSAHLEGPASQVITVASTSVRSNGQLSTVMVAAGGTARSRMVKLGEERDGRREVLSGLTVGEHVLLAPPETLQDGDSVEVKLAEAGQ